ncbi:hypothetical protein JVU11DRAFT_8390 [Chiua virens]|nr:hypothetical protein JVU11DRAFT_8390 [Chiua virens]
MLFLEAPEILLYICCLVFAITDGPSDLAILARTCRAFYKPAAAVLWRAQSSLIPLVCCFPRNILDFVRGDDDQLLSVTFKRSPSLKDWERPLIYVKFVKVFEFDKMHTRSPLIPHPNLIRTLLDSCPKLPLFPRLLVLDHYWITLNTQLQARQQDIQAALEVACLYKLSNPAVLRSLHVNLRVRRTDRDRCMLLRLLARCHANIESLQISNGNEELDIFNYLTHLGSLQKLKSLELTDFAPGSVSPLTVIPDTNTWFPNLHELKLRGHIPLVKLLLQTLDLPRLQNLCIQVGFRENPDPMCTLILSKLTWRESLRSIEIVGSDLSPGVLTKLFAFKHLRSLTLFPTHLDDDILERASRAWPMLEHFSLDDNVFGPLPSRDLNPPTLRGLIPLAKRCPHLRHLELQLDAGHIPQVPD